MAEQKHHHVSFYHNLWVCWLRIYFGIFEKGISAQIILSSISSARCLGSKVFFDRARKVDKSIFLFFFVHMIFFNNVMLCLNNESFSIMFLIRKRFLLMQNFFSVGVNFVRKREKFHWEAPMWKSVHNVRYNNIYWNIRWQRIAMVWESVHYVFLLGLHQIQPSYFHKHKRRFRWSGNHLYFMQPTSASPGGYSLQQKSLFCK